MLRGVLGIPLLENKKVTKCPSHVFDRYEIHIQDFEDFLRDNHPFPVPVFPKMIKDEVPEIPKLKNKSRKIEGA